MIPRDSWRYTIVTVPGWYRRQCAWASVFRNLPAQSEPMRRDEVQGEVLLQGASSTVDHLCSSTSESTEMKPYAHVQKVAVWKHHLGTVLPAHRSIDSKVVRLSYVVGTVPVSSLARTNQFIGQTRPFRGTSAGQLVVRHTNGSQRGRTR